VATRAAADLITEELGDGATVHVVAAPDKLQLVETLHALCPSVSNELKGNFFEILASELFLRFVDLAGELLPQVEEHVVCEDAGDGQVMRARVAHHELHAAHQ
jgi:hypothetical protein